MEVHLLTYWSINDSWVQILRQNRRKLGIGLDIVVADSNAKTQIALDYFFSTICEKETYLTESLSAAESALAKSAHLEIFVISDNLNGEEIMPLIRKAANLKTPPFIIAVDHKHSPQNRIEAYNAGANDVIRAPFSLVEFGLRLNLRIGNSFAKNLSAINRSGDDWDTEAFIANFAGLTPAETKIAHVLFDGRGTIVTRDHMSMAINGHAWNFGDRKFDVHLSNLRRKLNVHFGDGCKVETVHSVGYILTLESNLIAAQ